MYEFYIEKQRVDIEQQSAVALTYAIDDINQYGSKQTTFSKPLTLIGTARTNKVLGHVLAEASSNPYSTAVPNVNNNFNPSDVALCELRYNGLLLVKGIFRLTSIKLENKTYRYEGVIFGELGGFVASISNQRLEDLDFSEYDHVFSTANITGSWNTINGSSYYYPLIDYGTYSTDKINYQFGTLRPAFYAKEYIDKIFEAAGFTYESDFLNTALFKTFIIPHSTKNLERTDSRILYAIKTTPQNFTAPGFIEYDSATGGNFIITANNSSFKWNTSSVLANISVDIIGSFTNSGENFNIGISINGVLVAFESFGVAASPQLINTTLTADVTINNNDIIRISVEKSGVGGFDVDISESLIFIETSPPTRVIVDINENVIANNVIPRGIFQRDFFSSILKMFNLYVTEDKLKDNHLIITPYVDYYNTVAAIDYNQKIDYSKGLEFVPMGQLNGRIFEYKYKNDSDFYNEGYQKKFNQSYGDLLYDTGFQFSKDRQTLEIIFSPSPLIQYTGTDKKVCAIYKKSKGNDIDQEELTDSNIRILFAKKITGVTSWNILNGVAVLSSQTTYGYAGHLDDPTNPTKDLNFGAPNELYCTVDTYPNRGLFNEYWNDYIQEITNKDSKILKCYAYLKAKDITELDFSRPVFINGVKWRINKIEDYNTEEPVTRIELLKVING